MTTTHNRTSLTWFYLAALLFCIFIISLPVKAVYVKRFTTIANGAMTYTGNTLGLAKATGANTPGTNGSIGALITTDTSLKVNTYPSGTTLDWTKDSSRATLVIPAGSTVLYAELIWGGSYRYGTQNLTTSINNAVSFATPLGTFTVSPDSASATTLTGDNYYVRSADVTSMVKSGGAGVYTTGRVPGTSIAAENSANAAGWTLAVVYGNPTLPARNMTIFVGGELTNSSASPVSSVTGFCTPRVGPINARMMVSAIEGDSNITGDQMQFGPTTTTMAAVSGPNNPLSNFFCSQINKDDGTRDTSGSFGTTNHTPGGATSGARQGWDITNVNVSARMQNGMSAAYAKGTTTGDRYIITSIGLQIDVGAPSFPTAVTTVDKTTTYIGDTLTYTVKLDNTTGTADATNVVFTDIIPQGTSVVPGSFTINGVAQPAADPTVGVALGTIAAGSLVTVSLKVQVNSIPVQPSVAQFQNSGSWTYEYQSCPNFPTNSGTVTSNTTVTGLPRIQAQKTANPPGKAISGQVVTYTITVQNTGTVNSAGTTLIDQIPTGTNYVLGSTRLNGTAVADKSGKMPFTVESMVNSTGRPAGQINIGEQATVTFNVTIGPNPPVIITNTATVDPDGSANPAPSINAIVTNPPVQADLSVLIDDGKTTLAPGASNSYIITVTNNGPDAVISCVVSPNIPQTFSGVTYTASTGTYDAATGNWTGIYLTSGQSITLTANGTVDPTAADPLTLSVVLSPSPGIQDTNMANNTASDTDTLVPQADLLVTKTDERTSALPGDTVEYVVTVKNLGTSVVRSLKVVETLPAALLNPTFKPSFGVYNETNGTWNGLALLTDQLITLTIKGTVSAAASGNLVNTVTITALDSVTDPDLENNTATDTDTIGTAGSSIFGFVYEDSNHSSSLESGEVGNGITGLVVKLISAAGSVISTSPVNEMTGAFQFSGVPDGIYSMILDNNSTIVDKTPYLPSGWMGTEAPAQTRTGIIMAGRNVLNQNFGMFHGNTVSGYVFNDDGAGGGLANDGRMNGGENGLSNISVSAADLGGSVYDTTTTDSTGKYMLWLPYVLDSTPVIIRAKNLISYISTGGYIGNSGGVYDRSSGSITFTNSSLTTYNQLQFGAVAANIFTTDGSQTTMPGNVITYSHMYVAYTAGQLTFTTSRVANPSSVTWSEALYLDANNNGVIDVGDPLITGPLSLTGGEQMIPILVRVFVPANAPMNAKHVVTILASFNYVNSNPPLVIEYSHTDTTTVAKDSGLSLLKSVDRVRAASGDIITYTIKYANTSLSSISNLLINDYTPNYTSYYSASYDPLPSSLTGCTITAPDVGDTGAIQWLFSGALNSGRQGNVYYQVMVE